MVHHDVVFLNSLGLARGVSRLGNKRGVVIDWGLTGGVQGGGDATLIHEYGHWLGIPHMGNQKHIMVGGTTNHVSVEMISNDQATTFEED